MNFKLDHIVHVTKDPTMAVNDMKSLGLSAFVGGEHANWGTRNSLSHFGLTYIEFLGIQHIDIAKKVSDNTLIRQLVQENDEGLARLALRVNDIDQAANYFNELGLKIIGPVPGSRMQPDGTLLQWAMLFIEDDSADLFHLPFIIDWKQSDEERAKQLMDRGLLIKHPAGDVILSEIAITVKNANKTAKEWEKLFGAVISEPFIDEKWNAQCVRITLDQQSILFCEPLGEGLIESHLKMRCERPFQICFSNTGQKRNVLFHGGQYSFK